jgi:hypothetical protein
MQKMRNIVYLNSARYQAPQVLLALLQIGRIPYGCTPLFAV